MPEFRTRVFAKLAKKIERAAKEFDELTRHVAGYRDDILADKWGPSTSAAGGVHNVYNGIEDVLLNIARDVDGAVPDGPTLHQDLLDQMAATVPGIRHGLLADDIYRDLAELKGFRHVVRHRYGLELSGVRILENVERLQRVFPAFVSAVSALDEALATDHGSDP